MIGRIETIREAGKARSNPSPIPIHDHLRSLEAALSDAEWRGLDNRAAYLRREIERVHRDIERGELWEVPW